MPTTSQLRVVARGVLAAGTLGLGAVGLAPSAPATAAPTPADDRELVLTFSEVRGDLEDDAPIVNSGSAPMNGVVRTEHGGVARTFVGPGGGRALQLPDFAPGATRFTVPIAVVTVGGPGENAWRLNPGVSPFSVGASFQLSDSGESDVDNGDNLVQRGLWGAPSQYKVELDKQRPACRVKGAEGDVVVRGDFVVPRGRWFSVRCARDERGVTLTLDGRLSDGTSVHREWRRYGRTGSMWGLPGNVPLSVGGKTDDGGSPVTGASDQFNGRVDNVVVDIDR